MEKEYNVTQEYDPIDMRQYEKGFNDSFILASYEPTLLTDIIPSINPIDDYYTGFFDGKAQWEQEQVKNQMNEFEALRNTSIDRNLDLER